MLFTFYIPKVLLLLETVTVATLILFHFDVIYNLSFFSFNRFMLPNRIPHSEQVNLYKFY